MSTSPVQIVCGINGPIGYTRRPGVVWTYPAEARVSYLELPAPVDECHHCGAPSPGDVCRYCNTVHRMGPPRAACDDPAHAPTDWGPSMRSDWFCATCGTWTKNPKGTTMRKR